VLGDSLPFSQNGDHDANPNAHCDAKSDVAHHGAPTNSYGNTYGQTERKRSTLFLWVWTTRHAIPRYWYCEAEQLLLGKHGILKAFSFYHQPFYVQFVCDIDETHVCGLLGRQWDNPIHCPFQVQPCTLWVGSGRA
jgi:hypothetical protein